MMVEPDEHMTLGEIKRLYKEGKLKANPGKIVEDLKRVYGNPFALAKKTPMD